jgi:hypothetical protein
LRLGAGCTDSHHFAVDGLLGPSLATVRRRLPDAHFTLSTANSLAALMPPAIREFRHLGFVHRDIKLPNFVLKPGNFSPSFLSTSESGGVSSIPNPSGPSHAEATHSPAAKEQEGFEHGNPTNQQGTGKTRDTAWQLIPVTAVLDAGELWLSETVIVAFLDGDTRACKSPFDGPF